MAAVPDIWAYVSKGGPDLAGAKIAGYRAGTEKRKVEADIAARADELANRRSEFEGEMGLRKSEFSQRQKEHQDRVDQDTQRRADMLAEKFGPALVRGPDGEVDVPGSAAASQERIDMDRKAEALGMQEVILGKQAGPEFDSVKMMPGYVVGQTKGLAMKQTQQSQQARDAAKASNALAVAGVRSGKTSGTTTGGADAIVVQQGVPGVMSAKGNFKPLTGAALLEYRRANRSAGGGTNAPAAVIQFQRDASGNLVPVRPPR